MNYSSLLLVAIAAATTFLLRAFPFFVFSGDREMPPFVKKVSDLLPAAIIAVLVIYCLKSYLFVLTADALAALIAITGVVLVHLWKRNTLLSVAVGTVLYMAMIRIL